MSNNLLGYYVKADRKGRDSSFLIKGGMGSGLVFIKVKDKIFKEWMDLKGLLTDDPARGKVLIVKDQDDFGSLNKKEAYAEAFVKSLNEDGIEAVTDTYLL